MVLDIQNRFKRALRNLKDSIVQDIPPGLDDEANFRFNVYHISRITGHNPWYVENKLDRWHELGTIDTHDIDNFDTLLHRYCFHEGIAPPKFYILLNRDVRRPDDKLPPPSGRAPA